MRRSLLAFAIVAIIGGVAGFSVVRPRLPAAERGRRLAERTGCFGCHGPGGTHGAANPGRDDRSVPTFEGDVMMYARSAGEIRAWIRDGVTSKKAKSVTWQEQRDRGTLIMPAFKHRLTESQVNDLVAFVMATSGSPAPEDPRAARGLERAEALGCSGCHGAGGRLARSNPGSLKGYVPSWDGEDFTELVRDSTEFRQWVERGVARRLEHDRLAQWFLDRALLRMPGYSKHLEADDVESLWAYVQWLRSPAAQSDRVRMEQ